MKPEIELSHILIRPAGWNKRRWRAIAYATNSRKLFWSQTYSRLYDAEQVARVMAVDGVPIKREE